MVCACSAMATVSTATVSTIGSIGFVGNVDFLLWRAPMVSDFGVTSAATLQEAASIAVATLNTVAAMNIAKKQMDIAKAYQNIFEWETNRYFSAYAPCEQSYMISIGKTKEYILDYLGRSAKYSAAVTDGVRVSTANLMGALRTIPLCLDPSLLAKFNAANDRLMLDAIDTAYRVEDAEKQIRDDKRWKYREQALNRGRSLLKGSADFAKMGSNLYGAMQKDIATAAEGAMGALGYFGARNNTAYPTGTTSYAATDNDTNNFIRSSGNITNVGGLTNPRDVR